MDNRKAHWLSPKQLAQRWKCSDNTVRNLVASGKLPSVRLGEKLIRVPKNAVEEFEKCQ